MHRTLPLHAALLATLLYASSASAGVTFELLYAPCLTGNPEDIIADNGVIGRYRGAIDCNNKDFNGAGARTVLSLKVFQPWELGTMFLYYDITGPFVPAVGPVPSDNEKGGFFGGITVALSAKSMAKKFAGAELNLGPLYDVSLKYEIEHVSKFGMLHYYGLQWDLAVPFLDFLSVTTVIRNDFSFKGVDLQLGGALQKSFSLGPLDFVAGGFFSWGVFGEGEGIGSFAGSKGNWFFITQPQLALDFGKFITFPPGKLYLGVEGQIAYNRYLIQGKTENMLQGMFRWNL